MSSFVCLEDTGQKQRLKCSDEVAQIHPHIFRIRASEQTWHFHLLRHVPNTIFPKKVLLSRNQGNRRATVPNRSSDLCSEGIRVSGVVLRWFVLCLQASVYSPRVVKVSSPSACVLTSIRAAAPASRRASLDLSEVVALAAPG